MLLISSLINFLVEEIISKKTTPSDLSKDDQNRREAKSIAWLLLCHVTKKTRTELIALQSLSLSNHEKTDLEKGIYDITINHKPIQYILGSLPFLDLELAIRPPILIPRPETEEWCNNLIHYLKKLPASSSMNILDLCTGSGCIALALAQNFPNSQITALDISSQACALTKENIKKNNLSSIKIIKSDLFNSLTSQEKFDLIVANPPYIKPDILKKLDPEVYQWEDSNALIAEDEGLSCIKRIIQQAPNYLNPRSPIKELWIEISYEQAESVVELFKKANFNKCVSHYDF